MIKILLIGCGNIGKRYLQDISKDKNIIVYVVEINYESQLEAMKLIDDQNKNNVKFYNNIEDVYKDLKDKFFDFLIITTNSDVRFKLFSAAIEYFDIKYIILEKVLFSRIEDYYITFETIKSKNLKVWVNHTRRIFNFYKEFKSNLLQNNEKILFFKYKGYKWNILSNCLHLMDLFFFLNDEDSEIKNFDIDIYIKDFFNSKRKGFIEAQGEIYLKNSNRFLILSDLEVYKYNEEDKFYFECEKNAYIISEKDSKLITIKNEFINEKNINILEYQSNISRKTINEILINGNSSLPDYFISMNLHLLFLEKIIKKFPKLFSKDYIPIT